LQYCPGFVIRITRADVLNRIYGERIYFVELRREWSKGLKLIFMEKTSNTDYSFIGSGIIDQIIHPEKLNNREKLLCVNNNCYRKIVFGQLSKFFPGINVKHTIKGSWKSIALLHGMGLSASDIVKLENNAIVSITS
jgi:hypothetical protein